jgi:hypothetical protein
MSFRECLEEVLEVTKRKRFFVNVPGGRQNSGPVFGLLPKPLLTVDQVTLLKT